MLISWRDNCHWNIGVVHTVITDTAKKCAAHNPIKLLKISKNPMIFKKKLSDLW